MAPTEKDKFGKYFDLGTGAVKARKASRAARRRARAKTNLLLNDINDLTEEGGVEDPSNMSQLRVLRQKLARFHGFLTDLKELLKARPIAGYFPHPKQLAMHKDKRPYIFIGGANRAGKTKSLLGELVWHIEGTHPHKKVPRPPFTIYVVSTNLDKLENEEGQLIWDMKRHITADHPLGKPRKDKNTFLFSNDVTVIMKSDFQDVSSAKGGQPVLILVDEEIKYDYFKELMARRISRGGQIIVGATSTPEHGGVTWIFDRIIKGKDLLRNNHEHWGIYCVSAWDNPYLDQKQLKVEYDLMEPSERAVRIDGDLTPRAKNPVFSLTALETMWKRRQGITLTPTYCDVYYEPSEEAPLFIDAPLTGALSIFRQPIIGHDYVVAGDAARDGRDDDYNVWQVLDLLTFEQVAIWRGHIDPRMMADVGAALGVHYNTAMVSVELMREGFAVIQRLIHDYHYPRLFHGVQVASGKAKPSSMVGWVPTPGNKHAAVGSLADALRPLGPRQAGLLYVYDPITYQELRYYEVKNSGKVGAMHGLNDDCVMALVQAVHIAMNSGHMLQGIGTPNTHKIGSFRGVDRQHAAEEAANKAKERTISPTLGNIF